MHLKISHAILLPGLILLAAGCATTSKQSKADSSHRQELLEKARSENTPDAREFASIDAEYRKHGYDEVLKRTRAFIKTYSKSEYLAETYNLRGLAFIGLKQYQNAAINLRKAYDMASEDGLRNMAAYNLAYVHFETGQIDQASVALEPVKISSLDRGDRVKFYVLRAKIARLKKDYQGSAQEILSAIKNVPEPRPTATLDPMLGFLDEALEPLNNIVVLERLYGDFEDSPAADRLLYKLGSLYLASGDRDKAKGYFEKLANNFPDSRYYAAARENGRKLDFQGVVDPRRIGVVLTLSGKIGKFGQRALQGLQLALKIFQAPNDPTPISLVVLDDLGEQDRALAAMDELFYKHHVSAIVGPLVSKLAEPMGKKAQELGIPLIALTQKEASGGDYVFNAALTPAMQVRELVRYATEKAGVKSFAILSPEGKFGAEYANAFWDEIDRTGGAIRGFEKYGDEETDFRAYVDKLVGLAQTDARAHEVEELRVLKAATPMKTKSKKFDRMFELKPIVDFQAVFIPDEPKALGQILPTFAYRDVDNVLFLGINTWNNPELIARAGQFAEGAVFVDGFWAGSESPSSKKFIEEYRNTFNADPTLVEALSYDAGNILASLMKKSDVRSRADLRDRIRDLKDFPGITGKISYREGRLTKNLSLLTVKGGKIEEIAF